MLKMMKRLQLQSASTYSTLMTRSSPQIGLRLYKLMETDSVVSSSIDIQAINILMNIYSKLDDEVSANSLLKKLELDPTIPPNIITYNTFIDACSRNGSLELALSGLARLRKYSLEPDTTTYTSLISTVARKGSNNSNRFGAMDPDMGFQLFNEMKSLNILPNSITYCALIEVCNRCGRGE